jgi:hypothetical protein
MAQAVVSLKGQTGQMVSVAYSPDGTLISGQTASGQFQGGKVFTWDATTGHMLPDADPVPVRQQTQALSPDGSRRAFIEEGQIKVVLLEEQKRQQALDRAVLARLARPDPEYHRSKADQYARSGELFAAAFHLRRLLGIEAKQEVRQLLAFIESKLAAEAKRDAQLPEKPPARMPYAD